jgi:hypothetical protein
MLMLLLLLLRHDERISSRWRHDGRVTGESQVTRAVVQLVLVRGMQTPRVMVWVCLVGDGQRFSV